MSDARTDFFDSRAKPAAKGISRDDFFAGKNTVPDDAAVTEDKPATNYSSPYAYYSPEVQRELKNDGSGIRALAETAPGFNRGVASVLGLPMDTATSAVDLLGAGYGTAASLLTGKPAGEFFEPYDRSQVAGTGEWMANLMDSSPLGPITQMYNPDDAGARLVYGAASGVAPALIGGGPAAPQIASGIAGAGAGAIASEMGADPATQAALSLGAGALVGISPRTAPGESLQTPQKPAKPTAQELLNQSASKQSMGAAGAAVDLQKLSPALRVEVEKAVQKTGGAVNEQAMARQIQADSLPVKVPMSEGQVLGDARLITEERNARGKTPGAVEAFAGQNKALTENLRVFRDTAGDGVFSTNQIEHGDTLIARYQAIDEARNTEIGAKYQALRDAAGGAFPVDTQSLLTNVRAALKKDLATSKAPSDVMALLEERAAAGSMTLEDFEALRTSLSRTQRSASDGQERHAAGVIRNQIEAMPLQAGAEQLKDLADAARAAARERFQALEADPAYKAAVNETTPPDKFVQKFVINGTRDNVGRMSETMKGDETAAQTLKVATLDHLRQAAGIDGSYNGNFSQAGFNKALRALEPKIGALLDPQLVEHVQNLGDVARYSQLQPEGHYINNSNTFVASAADKAASVAEKAVNMAVPGLDAGTFIREKASAAAAARKVRKSWGPGAGLTRLSDLTEVGKEKK